MSAVFAIEYYQQLIGCKITGFRFESDELGDDFPIFTAITENGEELDLTVSRDPEGNGGGFIFIEEAK